MLSSQIIPPINLPNFSSSPLFSPSPSPSPSPSRSSSRLPSRSPSPSFLVPALDLDPSSLSFLPLVSDHPLLSPLPSVSDSLSLSLFNGLNFFRELCLLNNQTIKFFILPHSDEQSMDVNQELNNISLDVSLGKDSNNNISILPNTKKNIQSLKQSLDTLISEKAINCFFVVEDTKTHIAFINKNINKFNKDSILAKTYSDAQRELEKLKQQIDPLTVCVILDMNFP